MGFGFRGRAVLHEKNPLQQGLFVRASLVQPKFQQKESGFPVGTYFLTKEPLHFYRGVPKIGVPFLRVA